MNHKKIANSLSNIDISAISKLCDDIYHYKNDEYRKKFFEKHDQLELVNPGPLEINEERLILIHYEYLNLMNDSSFMYYSNIKKLSTLERSLLDSFLYEMIYADIF